MKKRLTENKDMQNNSCSFDAINKFIDEYDPVKSPYEDMKDAAYNARRVATMAKQKFKLGYAGCVTVQFLYLQKHIDKLRY